MCLPIALIGVHTRAASHNLTRSALNCIKSESLERWGRDTEEETHE
ncbi:hypothetical protein HMPREF9597_02099 [Cutibacterium acnes HL005PA4]|jgi:hypothetical protein|nr:hypothetical protein HMPREF9575_00166 [Cutibacterium acnes HL110PA1]EFS68927.1 hypothetical protein HMPREF9616_01132 [Cutibacterium acnes HL007PA1]EFS78611.1 hypothetical protein HMPREF9597_02099 [Cutibacterium acnes HL005PA4]EFT51613.1 hypothetical protein HMPREF9565_00311 [Cutibacterium acnes HL053PA2]EFT53125.1 hypothetical protein HMPREF9569_01162 [Cutibacterium acnes HL078PA1]EFT71086.1 hypothetical protein HMPREF9590_00027 [Cutibacterium acnes HL059PA2]EFT78876.1 hypothetical protein